MINFSFLFFFFWNTFENFAPGLSIDFPPVYPLEKKGKRKEKSISIPTRFGRILFLSLGLLKKFIPSILKSLSSSPGRGEKRNGGRAETEGDEKYESSDGTRGR